MPDNATFTQYAAEILFVEDNPNDVELTLHAFAKQHPTSRVHSVRDGAEALEYIFATGRYAGRDLGEGPKCILLDLKLPKVSGIEVLRRIRADPRTRLIPIVVLTSSREESDLNETYRLGINSYIVKPVEFERLSELVATIGHYWLVVNQQPPSAHRTEASS